MRLRHWLFSLGTPPPSPAPVDPEIFATIARAPVLNPGDVEQQNFAVYRADAIAREVEQRRREYREPHPDHAQIVAEAMSYAWMAVRGGMWTREHVAALQTRLLGR